MSRASSYFCSRSSSHACRASSIAFCSIATRNAPRSPAPAAGQSPHARATGEQRAAVCIGRGSRGSGARGEEELRETGTGARHVRRASRSWCRRVSHARRTRRRRPSTSVVGVPQLLELDRRAVACCVAWCRPPSAETASWGASIRHDRRAAPPDAGTAACCAMTSLDSATVLPRFCHGSTLFSPWFCHASAAFLPHVSLVLPFFCLDSATILPPFYRTSAIVSPNSASLASISLPLFHPASPASATILPLFCRHSARVNPFLPLFCHCSAAFLAVSAALERSENFGAKRKRAFLKRRRRRRRRTTDGHDETAAIGRRRALRDAGGRCRFDRDGQVEQGENVYRAPCTKAQRRGGRLKRPQTTRRRTARRWTARGPPEAPQRLRDRDKGRCTMRRERRSASLA